MEKETIILKINKIKMELSKDKRDRIEQQQKPKVIQRTAQSSTQIPPSKRHKGEQTVRTSTSVNVVVPLQLFILKFCEDVQKKKMFESFDVSLFMLKLRTIYRFTPIYNCMILSSSNRYHFKFAFKRSYYEITIITNEVHKLTRLILKIDNENIIDYNDGTQKKGNIQTFNDDKLHHSSTEYQLNDSIHCVNRIQYSFNSWNLFLQIRKGSVQSNKKSLYRRIYSNTLFTILIILIFVTEIVKSRLTKNDRTFGKKEDFKYQFL